MQPRKFMFRLPSIDHCQLSRIEVFEKVEKYYVQKIELKYT